ncbi:MAG: Gfo/Idh/MocA family protein [Beutenbergiaceae bacterium]
MTLASPLPVAVVGLGAIGVEHAEIYQASPLAELAAVVEPRAQVRMEVAARLGCQGFETVAQLLESDVAAVSLCTPDHLHYEDARTIVAAGRHLLVEKPISTDPVQADELTRLAESADVVVMPGQTLRFEPRYARAREVVAAGRVGQIQHGYLRRDNKLSVAHRAAGRTSVAYFLGIHDIDALQWITNQRVVQVQALASTATEATGAQALAVVANLRLSGGAVVQLESAWNLPENYPTDLDAALRLVGSSGVVSVHSFDAGMAVTDAQFYLPMPAGAPLYGATQGALALELESFLRAVQGDIALPVTVREAAAAVKVVAALHQGLQTGGTVEVEPVVPAEVR